jgi:predicted ATPase
MNRCSCTRRHEGRKVVLTGGPGAGKSAVLELARLFFCEHVRPLPEAAGIVFGGRFPRNGTDDIRRAAQRAIYHVQRELEMTTTPSEAAVLLCDRGTVDGAAYWPGPGELWDAVGTTREAELARYHAVIHLRTPSAQAYTNDNPLRVETHAEASEIDAAIARAWAGHPRLHDVAASEDFLSKAAHALDLLRDMVPECCRSRVKPFLWAPAARSEASGAGSVSS